MTNAKEKEQVVRKEGKLKRDKERQSAVEGEHNKNAEQQRGWYFEHDDRSGQNRKQGPNHKRMNGRRTKKPAQKENRSADSNWKHDKFEELEAITKEVASSSEPKTPKQKENRRNRNYRSRRRGEYKEKNEAESTEPAQNATTKQSEKTDAHAMDDKVIEIKPKHEGRSRQRKPRSNPDGKVKKVSPERTNADEVRSRVAQHKNRPRQTKRYVRSPKAERPKIEATKHLQSTVVDGHVDAADNTDSVDTSSQNSQQYQDENVHVNTMQTMQEMQYIIDSVPSYQGQHPIQWTAYAGINPNNLVASEVLMYRPMPAAFVNAEPYIPLQKRGLVRN